jgi:hypothetical protein
MALPFALDRPANVRALLDQLYCNCYCRGTGLTAQLGIGSGVVQAQVRP